MIAELTFVENESGFLKVAIDEEKLYVKSTDSEETFALRSLNGIGISHNTAKYNEEKEKAGGQGTKIVGYALAVIGGAGAGWGFMQEDGWLMGSEFVGLALGGLGIAGKASQETVMESALTLTVGGGSKKFVYPNKDYPNPTVPKDIEEFIARVEETLTAYNSGS